MCGIFGFITNNPSEENLEVLKDLCYLSAARGTDSTGIAIVSKNRVLIEKEPVPSPDFIKKYLPKYEKEIAKSNIVIGHTRKWTQGKPNDNNNNHPVISDNWIMVHNGMCSSMDRIKDYKYRGEVDSEVLLSYVEKYGIQEGLTYLSGYAAIASLNLKKPNDLYLWRHRENIYVGYDREKSTLFFCSSKDIAENGLANELLLFSTYQIRELPEDELYKLTYNPLDIEDLGEIEIKKPSYTYGSHTNWMGKFWNKEKSQEEYKSKTTWEWSNELQCLIPKDKVIEATVVEDRYYFNKQSADFINWKRVGKCFVSPDGLLIKMWDKDKGTHFITSIASALKDKLIDAPVLQIIKGDK